MSTKKVASYEEACKVLNIKPISEDAVNAFPQEDRKSLLAYHKLTIIARALNEGWLPDWNNTNQRKYYPIFQYTLAGLSCAITLNASRGFVYVYVLRLSALLLRPRNGGIRGKHVPRPLYGLLLPYPSNRAKEGATSRQRSNGRRLRGRRKRVSKRGNKDCRK